MLKKVIFLLTILLLLFASTSAATLSFGSFGSNEYIKSEGMAITLDFEKLLAHIFSLGLGFTAANFTTKIPININGTNDSYNDYFSNSVTITDLYFKKYFFKKSYDDNSGNIYFKLGGSIYTPSAIKTDTTHYEQFLNDNGISFDNYDTLISAKYSNGKLAAIGLEITPRLTLEAAYRAYDLNIDYHAEGSTVGTTLITRGNGLFTRSIYTTNIIFRF